jgi:hypothetical protein
VLPVQGGALEHQLLAMRLLSAVLASLAVLPAYGLLRLIAPRDAFVPIAGAALIAALPMSVYMGGMMNNDNLLLLLGMLTAYGMTLGLTRGFSVGNWALILAGVVLGLLTKRGAVILLPGVAACAVVWLVRLPPVPRTWIALSFASAGALLGLGVTSGFLARLLPIERAQAALIAYALNGLFQWENLLRVPLDAPQTRAIVGAQLDAFFISFWGIFGWFSVPLSVDLYELLRNVTRVCALGFLGWCSGLLQPKLVPAGQRLTLAAVLIILVVSGVVAGIAERLAYYSPGEVPQGRYLFIVLGPIAALYALGLRAWLPRRFVGTALPVMAVIAGLVALDLYAFLGVIQPYFGRTFQ